MTLLPLENPNYAVQMRQKEPINRKQTTSCLIAVGVMTGVLLIDMTSYALFFAGAIIVVVLAICATSIE